MKLVLLYLDNRLEEFKVKRVFQDKSHGMGRLYYETYFDERGKGKIVNIDDLMTWEIEPYN